MRIAKGKPPTLPLKLFIQSAGPLPPPRFPALISLSLLPVLIQLITSSCWIYSPGWASGTHTVLSFRLPDQLFHFSAGSSFLLHLFFFFFFFLSFCHFQGRSHGIWRFPGQGSNWSYSLRPMPQPQQRRIPAASATFTTADGQGSNPQPHGSQSDTLTTEPQQELH